MSQVFVIADTHFFHDKVLEFEKEARPFSSVEEMNEALVDRWNAVVTKRDTVWHLGDVLFGSMDKLEILSRLNGNKNLVLGNHDLHGTQTYLKYFRNVEGMKKYDGCLLTHIPIHSDQMSRYKANVHGHLHSKRVLQDTMYADCIDSRYICVSCEHTDLAPLPWENVRAII